MYETFSEWPIVPYFQWGLHLSLEKLQIFDLHTPLNFEAKDSTLNSMSWFNGSQWSSEARASYTSIEEEDDDDEEDEEEGRIEEGNRVKRRKA